MPDSPKLHPLAHPVPGWVEALLNNPGLREEYETYLQDLLTSYREKQDNADDMTAFAKIRGSVEVLKSQLTYLSNWSIERKRRDKSRDF